MGNIKNKINTKENELYIDNLINNFDENTIKTIKTLNKPKTFILNNIELIITTIENDIINNINNQNYFNKLSKNTYYNKEIFTILEKQIKIQNYTIAYQYIIEKSSQNYIIRISDIKNYNWFFKEYTQSLSASKFEKEEIQKNLNGTFDNFTSLQDYIIRNCKDDFIAFNFKYLVNIHKSNLLSNNIITLNK